MLAVHVAPASAKGRIVHTRNLHSWRSAQQRLHVALACIPVNYGALGKAVWRLCKESQPQKGNRRDMGNDCEQACSANLETS